jgi:hypothetical protein
MGNLSFHRQQRFSRSVRKACVTTLACLIGISPVTPAFASQGSAQAGAGGTNSLAQGLSQAMGVVSMGLGGLYMAKGAQQLACCSSGCTGSGAGSQATKQDLDKAAKDRASTIKRKPDLRPLDEANSGCRAPSLGIFSFWSFWQPTEARAAGGCIDAMIALATGGLMLLQGILSLQAANQAGQNASDAFGNSTGMGSLGSATSPTPNSVSRANIASSSRNGELIKIDPSLLRTGKANEIMAQFEDKFGIPRDKFANAVLNGEDPRKLLGSAPRNALSNADMNKALSSAKAMSEAEKSGALADTGILDAQKELTAKMEQYAVNMGGGNGGGGVGSPFRSAASKKSDEDLDSLDSSVGPASAAVPVSPEVQAALTQKALEERSNGIHDLTLFQVVHNKLREKSKTIFGYDPDGVPKGVSDADGI